MSKLLLDTNSEDFIGERSVFFGLLFQRALRKSLDSVASAICWNAIYLIDDSTWQEFCRQVRYSEGPLWSRCAKVWVEVDHAVTLLRLGLDLLTKEEWDVLAKASFLEGEDVEGN